MPQSVINSLLIVLLLAAAAQWLAWALRLPAILLLLLFGFLAGPVFGVIHPDTLFGTLLLPLVSLSVALILFEGGLGLNVKELRGAGSVVWRLVTLGALLTWAVVGLAAHLILGLDAPLAALLGATLTVTGPTVVLPLLDFVKPKGAVGPVLKWEGIVIDPIGALLAVVVFEAVLSGRLEEAPLHLGWVLLRSLGAGAVLGLAAAWLLIQMLRRRIVPDGLQVIVTMTLVLCAFGLANLFQKESGLAAATVMGIVLANQRSADLRGIVEFKENLRVLLLSGVFILLSARLRLEDFGRLGTETAVFLLVVVVVARPLCVTAATAGSPLTWRERLFVMWMAPRGIVAAAVSSVFSLALEQAGYAQARLLLPITFACIVGTVVLYGLTAAPLARRLGLSERDPQGFLFVGATRFARAAASALKQAGFNVLLVDTNLAAVAEARTAGLPAFHGSVLNEDLLEKIDLAGIGRLLALTPNAEVNLLATDRFGRVFGRGSVYQLPPRTDFFGQTAHHHQAPSLFDTEATCEALERLIEQGATVRATPITDAFTYEDFRRHHGDRALLLFIISKSRIKVVTAGQNPAPRSGQVVLSLVRPAPADQSLPPASEPTPAPVSG
ncbi:MAG: cation:proton antiporter [Phycisphaerae bacterium]